MQSPVRPAGTQNLGNLALNGHITGQVPAGTVDAASHIGVNEQAVQHAVKHISHGRSSESAEILQHPQGVEAQGIAVADEGPRVGAGNQQEAADGT